MIRMISLDIWGTLITAPPSLPKLLANYLAARTGREPPTVGDFIASIGREFDQRAIRSGRDISSSEKLSDLAHAVGISDPDADELQREVRRHLKLEPPFLIERSACLESLRLLRNREFEITFASNSGFIGGEAMRSILATLGLLDQGDRCVFSDELGFAKPSAEFFLEVAGARDPMTVLHIGDNAEADVAGATGAGMSALHYVRQGRTFEGVKQIRSLAVLPDLIDARCVGQRFADDHEP